MEEQLVGKHVILSSPSFFLGFLSADGTVHRLVAVYDLKMSACVAGQEACLWKNKWDAVFDCESIYDEEFNSARHGVALIFHHENGWHKKKVPHNRQSFTSRLYFDDGSRKSRLDALFGIDPRHRHMTKFPVADTFTLLEYFGGAEVDIDTLAKGIVNVYRCLKIRLHSNPVSSSPATKISYHKIVEAMLYQELSDYDMYMAIGVPEEEKSIDSDEYNMITSKMTPTPETLDPSLMLTLCNKLQRMLLAGPRSWDSARRGEAGQAVIPASAKYAEEDEPKVQTFTCVEDVLRMLGMM